MDDAIDRAKMDAIDRAKRGDLKFFKEAPLEILLNARDSFDDTVLSIVVKYDHPDCCAVICKRCPSLLYHQTSQRGHTPLHSAAYSGNLDILKLLISACDQADQEGDRAGKQKTLTLSTTRKGNNAMHKATHGGKPESVKLLIEADPNKELLRSCDRKDNTPLHLAVGLKSDPVIARLLIQADPDYPYVANSDQMTPLLMAIDKAEQHNDREMLKLIMELQPTQSMVSVNENGWTALHYCVSKQNLYAIGYIIQSYPESSNVPDKEGQNFFHHAVKSGSVNMVKHILGMKEITSTVLNSTDNSGRTPWDVAAESQNERMILCLHKDPTARVNKKLTATKNLHWVVETHNFVVMNVFMETNADFLMNIDEEVIQNSKDKKGNTILFKAAQENHLFLCKELYKRCPSLLYHQSKRGGTALHHAAWRGKPEIVKFLILAGFESYKENIPQKMLLTMVDGKSQTALHKAVRSYNRDAVKLLLEADPNNELLGAGDDSGNTPLHLAVGLKSDHEIARLLIKADPDFPYGANSDGMTPLLIAIDKQAELHNDRGKAELHLLYTIGHIIQSCPESSKVADNEGRNFFHHAVNSGNVNMVEHILGMKEITSTVLNSPDNSRRTPLEVAAESRNESMILCLHKDHRVNKKLTVTEKLNWIVENHNFVMMNIFMETNADFLMNIDLEVIKNSVDENGDTILFKAAQENHLFLCKELYKRCTPLLYHQNKDGITALHHAAWRGEPEMLKFLIEAGAKSYNTYAEDDIESGGGENIPQRKLLTMLDDQRDTALHKAVLSHKLEAVKLLVEADPYYMYGTNTSGDTPIMVAVREARPNENNFNSVKIRKLLFKMQPSQTMAHRGENGWPLLHQATFDGDLSSIEDIINFCPSCLELVDNENKNFLHIAAKWEKVEVVRLVLREKDVPFNVLNDQDNDGNTPLHIAARTGNEPLTRCFLFDHRVIKTTMNKEEQHVLKAINFDYDKRRAGVFGIKGPVNRSDLREQRDFDLVVGALIATVSFTAGITVPGGYISDGQNQGTAVFSKKVSFAVFIISNTLALIFSLYAVFSHFCASQMSEDADITSQLKVATFCTLASICCMMAAFVAGSFAVLANSNWLAIVVGIFSFVFFIFAFLPILKIAKQHKWATRASQHKRST